MSRLSLQERIEFVELYMKNNESVVQTFREYKRRHNIKDSNDPISRQTLLNLIKRWRETGNVADSSGRGRKRISNETVETIECEVEDADGQTSIRKLARNVDICKSSVQNVLKNKLKMRPYKFRIMQVLSEQHCQKRLEFCEAFTAKIEANESFLSSILFSDEATFHLNGIVSSHQFRTWAIENAHNYFERARNVEKINVWFAYSQKFWIPPFFFDENINGETYRDMLVNHLRPHLCRKRKLSTTIYQQDGATAHTSKETITLCQKIFRDRLIFHGQPTALIYHH